MPEATRVKLLKAEKRRNDLLKAVREFAKKQREEKEAATVKADKK
jgi:hypothetical protein